ncbi:hypothetical protein RMS29_027345 (plasmid) [Agrobacterium rosae]|uniref:Uncharacterized protein n=1 Tax=Agrobacterium rosae TaxID=1972867 RepID=A0ABU4W5K8_9HYPH|nr:hypothetical protein [Agrobacterium rosae]MDX8332055.1 hypothetical protein [Agrobacterium rosae]
MKPFFACLFGGLFAGLSVWGAQSLEASHLVTVVSAAIGGGVATYIGQKVLSVS